MKPKKKFLLFFLLIFLIIGVAFWVLSKRESRQDFPEHFINGILPNDEIIVVVDPSIDIIEVVKRHGDDPSTISQAECNKERPHERVYVVKVGKSKRLQKLEEYQVDSDVIETSVNPLYLFPPLGGRCD